MTSKPFLYVGIASKTHLVHATHNALQRMYADLSCPYVEDIEPVGGLVLARNQIAARFLAHPEATHLLLVDDDVAGFTAADVLRMMATGEGVIGGPLPARDFDLRTLRGAIARGIPDEELLLWLSPLLMHFLEDGRIPVRGSLAEVKAVSTGFLVVTREALTHMVKELGGATAKLEGRPVLTVFEFGVDERGSWIGEDFGFCLRWRAMGGRVWADLETRLLHVGQVAFWTDTLRNRIAKSGIVRAIRTPGDSPTSRSET